MTPDAHSQNELRSTGYEIFIAALSVLSLVNIVLYMLIPDEALSNVVLIMDGVLSLVFLGDFLVRLGAADSKSEYFFRGFGWADLLASIPVTSFKILRVFRLVRVVRLLREGGTDRLIVSIVRDRAGSALYTLLLIAFLVLEFGSLAVLHAEMGAPGANIETAQDSVWYLLVTMSTVGYGDQYPVTGVGRILGSVVIVVGVAIFGTLTGFLANAFLRSDDVPGEAGPDAVPGSPAPAPDTGEAAVTDDAVGAAPGGGPRGPRAGSDTTLARELEEMREQHRAALERIDRLLAEQG